MLERMFSPDNVVFRFMTKVGYIWWLHLLWLVCSLPVVTIGASTTALCYSCMKFRDKDERVTRNFFHSFKENFKQATVIFLLFVIVGGVLLIDLVVCSKMGTGAGKLIRYGVLALFIPYAMTMLYAFAIQAKFVNPVARTLKYAFWMAGKYWGYTLQMVILTGVVIYLNTTIILANYITLSMGVGIVVYLLSAYYHKIFSGLVSH